MNRVFIIAEAGSNWRMGTPKRDLDMGKRLIEAAALAKADAVKFQTYRAETVYVPNAGESDSLSAQGQKESIRDIFHDLAMPYEMIPDLASTARDEGIEFMSSPFSIEDAKALEPFVVRHKIASYEITHSRLIEYVARSGKPLILSRGGATEDEIAWAVGHFNAHGGKEITLLHCLAKYPAPLSSMNLRALVTLRNRFRCPVGLSDHSRDPILAPIAAVALGARVIEKHFTLHNRLPGPDHSFAITDTELCDLVRRIRECEAALGEETIAVHAEESELRRFAQRGLQATTEIQPGDLFREGVNFSILRPGKRPQGVHPKEIARVEGKIAKRRIPLGDGIQQGDY